MSISDTYDMDSVLFLQIQKKYLMEKIPIMTLGCSHHILPAGAIIFNVPLLKNIYFSDSVFVSPNQCHDKRWPLRKINLFMLGLYRME